VAPVTEKQYRKLLEDWEVVPIRDGTTIIGAAIRKGPEVHVGVWRDPGGAYRWVIRDMLNETIRRHGFAVTMVRRANRHGLAFCQRLGFRITEVKEELLLLRCERSRYA
jgi:hypothetical protein